MALPGLIILFFKYCVCFPQFKKCVGEKNCSFSTNALNIRSKIDVLDKEVENKLRLTRGI